MKEHHCYFSITPAPSGKPRLNPIMYLKDGDCYLVFASKGGADTNPDWYYNIKAHADVQIEVGDETIDARRRRLPALSAILSTNASFHLSDVRPIPT